MLSVEEAAKTLGITPVRVRVLCREGRVRGAFRVGRTWVIPHPVQAHRKARGRPATADATA